MTNVDFVELLRKYLNLILDCESALKMHYSLDNIPYKHLGKIPRQGKFEKDDSQIEIEYRFHGGGCQFVLNKIVLEYDIYINNGNYIATSSWKFYAFITSYINDETGLKESDVQQQLESLESRGILFRLFKDYHVYAIDLDWYYKKSL